jgi:uroporphyrinogen-III decarboxylase
MMPEPSVRFRTETVPEASVTPQVCVDEGLGRLLGRYLALYESAENKRRLQLTGTSWSILPEFPLLARVTGACLRDTYLDPEAFVAFTLAQRIYRFERWRDCTPLTLDIAYWPGVIMEAAAFGMRPLYPLDEDPWIVHEPVVADTVDIAGLRADFNTDGGVVRLMLTMSEFCRRHLPGFTVHVQAWDRAAVGIAMDLMGAENFLVNTITEPVLIHELMRRISDEGAAWSQARDDFLLRNGYPRESSISPGTGVSSAMNSAYVNLIADEVNMPMLSPAVYAEFVFPYEKALVERTGRLNYYHSCGCLTPFLPAIATLRPMVQHVSAWTDWATAVRIFKGTDTLLQKTLHPLKDVLELDARGMASVICEIMATADGQVDYCLIANGIDSPAGNLEATLASCDRWVEVAAGCLN